MRFFLSSIIALLVTISGTTYSFESQVNVYQLKIANSGVRLSSLPYHQGVKPSEAKQGAAMLAEKTKTTLPIKQREFTIFNTGFNFGTSTWNFDINYNNIPDVDTAKEFKNLFQIPNIKSKVQAGFTSQYCRNTDFTKMVRTMLMNGVKLRYSIYYQNQYIGYVEVTKNSICQ